MNVKTVCFRACDSGKSTMAALSRLTEGQILYTVARQKAGSTAMSRLAVHQVKVISIDREAK